MERCYNKGCGQEYDPNNNQDDSCRHHPGLPFFHDVYKGWSCCNKKSVDFTDFLNIKGCSLSKHSNVKPVIENGYLKKEDKKDMQCVKNSSDMKVIPIALKRPPFESEMIEIKPVVSQDLKDTIDNLQKINSKENETETKEKMVIGTVCKNSGCNETYTGTAKDNTQCQHHNGFAVFHEGIKFWTCCERKTTDFALFMSQPGCTFGQHVWVKKDDLNEKVVQCRYDWYQTAKNVIISIYAKKYHYAKCIIRANSIRLNATIVFLEPKDAVFQMDLELKGIVLANNIIVNMHTTKIEITMPKAERGQWEDLAYPPKPVNHSEKKNSPSKQSNINEKCYEEINLDDIKAETGVQLSELARTKSKDEDN